MGKISVCFIKNNHLIIIFYMLNIFKNNLRYLKFSSFVLNYFKNEGRIENDSRIIVNTIKLNQYYKL